MHIVEDTPTLPANWPDPLPEGAAHLAILLSGDTEHESVDALVAALPELLAQHLPAGCKVNLMFVDDYNADMHIPLLRKPMVCTVPDRHYHEEGDISMTAYGDDDDGE